MKIIFDKEEDMNKFLDSDFTCINIVKIPDEECDLYDGNCKKCILDHIEVTYVKNCNECANTCSCKAYYRGDLVNKLIKCEPRAK